MPRSTKLDNTRERKTLSENPKHIVDWPKDWELEGHGEYDGISQSMIHNWTSCPIKFLLGVNTYRQTENAGKTTNFGSMVHDVNDKVYTKGKYPTVKEINTYIDEFAIAEMKKTRVNEQQMEFEKAKAAAVLVPYFEFYRNDFKDKNFYDVEHVFDVRYNGARLRGKIDGKFLTKKKKKWLMEHKTKGMINEDGIMLALNMDFQNMFYILSDELETGKQAEGVLYNVIRNPSNKPLKNESLKAYHDKILKMCRSNPEHYYKRWEAPYTPSDHSLFRHDLCHILDHIKFRSEMYVHRGYGSCLAPWPCTYLKNCAGKTLKGLEKTGIRFTELEEDNGSKKKSVKKVGKKKAVRKVAKRIKK